jgi:hypothetical protein
MARPLTAIQLVLGGLFLASGAQLELKSVPPAAQAERLNPMTCREAAHAVQTKNRAVLAEARSEVIQIAQALDAARVANGYPATATISDKSQFDAMARLALAWCKEHPEQNLIGAGSVVLDVANRLERVDEQ